MDQRGFVSSIFDLSFSHFITPRIQKFIFVVLLVVAGVAGIAVLVAALGLGSGFFGKLGGLIVGVPAGALAFLLLAMYFRVMVEILIVAFKGVQYLQEIAEATKGGRSTG